MDSSDNARDLRDLIQTAQRIQAEVARVKDELSAKTADGESGGGLVRCVASCTGEILELSIDPMLLETPENRRMLSDLITGAVNTALTRAREIAQREMSRVTGGLPMPPGMFGA